MRAGRGLPSDTVHPSRVRVRRVRIEVDPFAIWRPRSRETFAFGRAHNSDVLPALKWNNAAGHNLALTVHLNDKYPSTIRRKIGVMRHAAFSRGHIDVTAVSPVFVRGYKHQMQPFSHLGEEQPLPLLDPGQGRRVGQQKMRIATKS